MLLSLKASTGTKGAPRAFSLTLAKITRSPPIGMKPTSRDPELEVKHDQYSKLVSLLGKHVDDLKIGGQPAFLKIIVDTLEYHFGKLKYEAREFTNTGVRHRQLEDGTIITDQDKYIKAIKTISSTSTSGKKCDESCTEEMKTEFASAIGAIAYALITQYQILVYVVALQRRTHDPLVMHLRRANALIRHIQRYPQIARIRPWSA